MGLFGFLYGGLGSVRSLFCVRFRYGFVNGGVVELVSVSDVINFLLEQLIIMYVGVVFWVLLCVV